MEPSAPVIPSNSSDMIQEPASITQSSTSTTRDPSIDVVRECMSQTLRISLLDGRVVEGVLECFDSFGNILLYHAIDISSRCFRLGTVLVPAKVRTQVRVCRPTLDLGQRIEIRRIAPLSDASDRLIS